MGIKSIVSPFSGSFRGRVFKAFIYTTFGAATIGGFYRCANRPAINAKISCQPEPPRCSLAIKGENTSFKKHPPKIRLPIESGFQRVSVRVINEEQAVVLLDSSKAKSGNWAIEVATDRGKLVFPGFLEVAAAGEKE